MAVSTADDVRCLSFRNTLLQSSSVFTSVSVLMTSSRRSQDFPAPGPLGFQGQPAAEVQKKASRSFDLRRLFAFSKKRSKESSLDESRPYLDDSFVEERLVDVDISTMVSRPSGVDHNEWLATHTLSFVENLNLIYGCLSDYCVPSLCTTMSGPGNVKYQWVDDRNRKCKCSAPQYIDYVMSYAHKCVYDETIFPTKYGNAFPSSFEATVRRLLRLLLHVIAHVYQCHSAQAQALGLLDCLNTVSYHFLVFTKRFRLIDDQEMEVLDDLYARLRSRAAARREQQTTGEIEAGLSGIVARTTSCFGETSSGGGKSCYNKSGFATLSCATPSCVTTSSCTTPSCATPFCATPSCAMPSCITPSCSTPLYMTPLFMAPSTSPAEIRAIECDIAKGCAEENKENLGRKNRSAMTVIPLMASVL